MTDTNNGSEQSSSPSRDPLKERFLEHFNLFPKGNPESTFTVLKYSVTTYKLFDGSTLTVDLVLDKWKEYILMCESESRSTKYMKSMEKFIVDRDFNTNFNPSFGGKSFLDKY
mgnify:CR=1 FL=1|tara:strand:+ start:1183 stop:1521 length:339 start_codon:yes stop_codon:yes gene_type:complete